MQAHSGMQIRSKSEIEASTSLLPLSDISADLPVMRPMSLARDSVSRERMPYAYATMKLSPVALSTVRQSAARYYMPEASTYNQRRTLALYFAYSGSKRASR